MAQWFKSMKLWLLHLLGARPTSIDLDMQSTDEKIKRSALVLHTHYRDEAMVAMVELLKAEQTRALYFLSSFDGSADKLHRLQGRLEAITGLIAFIHEAGALQALEVKSLRQKKQDEARTRVLKFGSKPQDVVI